MHFEDALEFEGDAIEVWKKVSAIGDIPSYGYGTRSLVVVSEGGGVTRVTVRFAFGGSG
jgi:hypothetical protein